MIRGETMKQEEVEDSAKNRLLDVRTMWVPDAPDSVDDFLA